MAKKGNRVKLRTLTNGELRYDVPYRTPDGRDLTKTFRTKRAADAYKTKQDEAKLRGVEYDPRSGGITFREYAQKWLNSRQDLKPTVLAGYRDALAPNNGGKRHKRLRHLRIDDVFGGYPVNRITRAQIQDWVNLMGSAGKAPSTIRNAYFIVHQVLKQAYIDGLVATNPAQRGHINLPTNHSTGRRATVDDPSQFLTAAQVDALVSATPWPYSVMTHVAAWAGLRAAELCGLQVGDVLLPEPSKNPSAPTRPGVLRVERTVQTIDRKLTYTTPKTKGSRRRVPLPAQATELLRGYLAEHPRRHEPTAPLFPAMRLRANKPTGRKNPAGVSAEKQASALASLTVAEAERRLDLDWSSPLRHGSFYKAVFRPAILRANRLIPSASISSSLVWHGLRHTYASLCVAAGIKPEQLSRRMGHANIGITLGVYVHLFQDNDAEAADMAALGAMSRPAVARHGNVIPLHG